MGRRVGSDEGASDEGRRCVKGAPQASEPESTVNEPEGQDAAQPGEPDSTVMSRPARQIVPEPGVMLLSGSAPDPDVEFRHLRYRDANWPADQSRHADGW
jgi:hypothetical protein